MIYRTKVHLSNEFATALFFELGNTPVGNKRFTISINRVVYGSEIFNRGKFKYIHVLL